MDRKEQRLKQAAWNYKAEYQNRKFVLAHLDDAFKAGADWMKTDLLIMPEKFSVKQQKIFNECIEAAIKHCKLGSTIYGVDVLEDVISKLESFKIYFP